VGVPDTCRNDEDRAGIESGAGETGVEKEVNLNGSLEDVKKFFAIRVPFPWTSLSE
jgi:hypothetical protein